MRERTELAYNAFKVNGVYFEDVITGYHTLNSSGRESLEKSLVLAETDRIDGSVLTGSKLPQREIEIEYLITSDDYGDFQNKFESLMKHCNVENAQIIFNDEPDKFYTGSIIVKEIEKARFQHSGKLSIVCADPFKYSVTEYELASSGWNFTYDGTYKSYPTFTVEFPATLDANGNNTNTSECGYVGFANSRGDVLQFGDPEATDYGDITYPATNPLNKTFKSVSDWTKNNSKLTSTSLVLTGTAAANSSGYAYASGYGSGTGYHGPSISKILTDTTSSKNFEFTWKQKFVGSKTQFGAFECLLWNNNNGTRTLIGAVDIRKTTKDTKTKIYFYADGALANKYNKTVACSKIGTSSIKKQGNTLTITCGGVTKSFTLSDAIAELIVNEVTFWFGRNASKAALGTNYLYKCSLKRFAYSKYEDIKNIFSAGDTLKVDCKTASVTLDSGDSEINAQTIGALGNDWEGFYLAPGANVIAFDYSDWATTAPTATMKYRKVYL